MNSIENRCVMLDQEIDELKSEILGDFVCNDEEDKLDQLIDLAMMLGEAYVYRDNTVTRLLNQKMLLNHSKKIKEKEVEFK